MLLDSERTDFASWTVIIFCMCMAGRGWGCVLTDSARRVQEGSNVRLPCTFSNCPGPLDHSVHLNWEFNDTDFLFYYENQSFELWPNTECVGDVLAGDFSVLLRSVTLRHAGIYTCLVRPLHSAVIYKNHTLLTIAPSRSGRRITLNSDPTVSSLRLWLILGCCGVGLLLLAVGGMLVVGMSWRRGRDQQSHQSKNQGTPAPTEETQHPQKEQDIDCYVTLQRCKAPPQAAKEDSIYVTMHGRSAAPGIQAQPSRNRKAIPTEWHAQENPPHVKNENPPPCVPTVVPLVC